MNTPNEDRDETTINFHDRLVDRALAEIVGGEAPPDLAARILAADKVEKHSIATLVVTAKPAHARRWWALAVAAMLLIGVTVLMVPGVRNARELGRRASPSAKVENRALAIQGPTTTSVGKEWGSTPQNRRGKVVFGDAGIEGRIVLDNSGALPAETATESADDSYDGVDFDSKVDLLASTIQSDRYAAPATPPQYEPNLSLVISQSQTVLNESLAKEMSDSFGSLPADSQALVATSDGTLPATTQPQAQSGLEQLRQAVSKSVQSKSNDTAEGTGPGLSGDQYTRIYENPFIKAGGAGAVSTFSIDVDTASYANVRQFLLDMNTLPPPDAVRIEELVNYFDYDYPGPTADSRSRLSDAGDDADDQEDADEAAPFAAHVEVAGCLWKPEHRLVRIGIKGRELDRANRPRSNLVFLVDVSGSMDEPNKLPLVVYGLEQLTRELGENDRVAIVVYASSEGLVLPSTPGSKQQEVLQALGALAAGGSTAGGAGIQLAYQIAEDNFVEGGTNRVILCTDGDFNVGVTSTAELERLVEQKAKDTGVFLSVLGFGRGNLNDAMMEAIAGHGNGNHYYVDGRTEARRVLVEELTGTLVTIAKDVKIQVEFNPRQVAGYRLIGYENRMLRTEDFNDDTKDAGEIGAGHTVTALYEVVPAGLAVDVPEIDDLKYQPAAPKAKAVASEDDDRISDDETGELLTLKMRYKEPAGDVSRKLDWAITDDGESFSGASNDFQFAAAVAGFGLLLRDSEHKGNLSYGAIVEVAEANADDAESVEKNERDRRAEFVELVRRARSLRGD